MKHYRRILGSLALAAASAIALGQAADLNTAAPTKNDYRLRVLEPGEGATISGSTIRVVVSTEIRGQPAGEPRDSSSIPKPEVVVFLDDQQKGVLKDQQNVLTLENVPVGTHKLVILAKNLSGEVIDRKEIRFASTTEAAAAPAPAYQAPSASSPGSPTGSTATTTTTTMRTTEASQSKTEETLPETGSAFPAIALGGLGLIAAGFALRRKL